MGAKSLEEMDNRVRKYSLMRGAEKMNSSFADFIARQIVLVLFIWLVSALVCPEFCRKLATEKGYSTRSWAVLGFSFGLFALICMVGLPRKDDDFRRVIDDLRTIRLLLEKKQVE